ncbi:MAG: TetR/AcrR family transcriptional regulator [Panacagrimonas sp.]
MLLDNALDLIRESGLLNLQMARIAAKAEYAVGTVYLHFASKEDLLLALLTRALGDYQELLDRVAAWQAPSRDRMFAIGVADMIFVRRHPDYFRVFQYSLSEAAWQAASPERRQGFLQGNDPLVEVLVRIVEDARRAGDLEPEGQTAQEMGIGLWALCSGYHFYAHAEGIMEDFSVHDPYPLMCRHIQALLDGYRWKPLSDPADRGATDRLIEQIRNEVFEDVCNAR